MNPTESISMIQRACSLAARLHQFQKRKDEITPYVAHPMRVAFILSQLFNCQDAVVIATGILHDLIEDTTGDYDDIADEVSIEVADLVACLTKDMRVREDEREHLYDEQLRRGPWQARLIKLADVYDNLCDSRTTARPVKVRDKVERALELAGDEPELRLAAGLLHALLANARETKP